MTLLVLKKYLATRWVAVVPTLMVSCVSVRIVLLGGSVTLVNQDTGTYASTTLTAVKVTAHLLVSRPLSVVIF